MALPLLVLLFCAPAARADQADVLFDPGHVAAIDIDLPAASRTALDADPDTYQQAGLTVTAGGVTSGPLQVGIRLKGHVGGSFRDLSGKAAFKLKFNHVVSGQKLLGLKKLTLNNMVQDPSMLHETLAYETFRASGVPAPRSGYAFVRVNDDPYGVYLNVETMDDVGLKRLFQSTGHLYEGGYATDVRPGDVSKFEIDEGSETDRGDLNALVAAAGGSGDFSDRMAGRADLSEMVRMWAVEKYAGHWDGYAGKDGDLLPNNYYLHSTTSGLFSMLPWGTDQTWVHDIGFDEGGLLFRRCRLDPSCEATYEAALAGVAATVDRLDLPAETERLAAVLRPYQERDPRKDSSMGEIGGWVQGTQSYLAARPGQVSSWLAAPTPPPAEPVAEPEPVAGANAPEAGLPVAPAAVAQGPGPARAALRVGHARRSKAVVSTPVRVTAAGLVSQRMVMAVRGRDVTACRVPARRLGAGTHTLRCRLSAVVRHRLRAGRLRLIVRTRLSGAPLVRSSLMLARCHGC